MRAEDGEEEEEEGDEEEEAPAEEEGRAARIPSGGREKAVRRENAMGFEFEFEFGVRAGTGALEGGPSERSGEDAKRSDSLSSKEEEEVVEEGEEGEVRSDRNRLGLKALFERCRSINPRPTLIGEGEGGDEVGE